MRQIIIAFFIVGLILLLYSCEITDYDLGPIHNHSPRLEITNLYTDGVLTVMAFDWYQKNDTAPVEKLFNFWRYRVYETLVVCDTLEVCDTLVNEWINHFGDYLKLPVEPDDFLIVLTPKNTYPPDTTVIKVTRRTKHVEVLIRHNIMIL